MVTLRNLLPPPIELGPVASRFAPAGNELRQERELLRRVDTKFIATRAMAVAVLGTLVDDYAALVVPAGNIAAYRSLYFDTPDRRSYHDHRRGRRPRYKVRVRHYPDRRLSFLEVKIKRNEAVTDKHRVSLGYGDEALTPAARAYLASVGVPDPDALAPVLRVDFRRLSLVGLDTPERVTVDVAIEAERLDGARRSFDELTVIEVKQAPFCVRTPVMRAVHAAGLREQTMSKYTVASALLWPELRRNRLRPDVHAIERMICERD